MSSSWRSWLAEDAVKLGPAGRPILALVRDWDGHSALELPDEKKDQDVRYASGAWDGIATHHLGGATDEARADAATRVVKALERLAAGGGDDARAELYNLFVDDPVVLYADAIVERLTQQDKIGPDDVRPHARWLVQEATHREPLKLGVVLLGASGTEEDLPDLQVLARHDEFTLFAAVASTSLSQQPLDVLWQIARGVNGWGKIHVVERIGRRADGRADVKAWLLRQGCQNTVMPEYLACICAKAGDLAGALQGDVDEALLDGACLIVHAILEGGPAEDIEGYAEGATAVARLIEQLERRCDSLARLEVVASVLEWLEWPTTEAPRALDAEPEDEGDDDEEEDDEEGEHEGGVEAEDEADGDEPEDVWERRRGLGWTDVLRARVALGCRRILERPEWPGAIRSAFAGDDERRRWLAWSVSDAASVDLWDEAYARLEGSPTEPALYFHLLQTDRLDRARRVVSLAESRLPLDAIATGPGARREPASPANECLDFLLQEMRREELFSDTLVATGLRSGNQRNRSLAAAALEQHPAPRWGAVVRTALRRSAVEEPRAELRERLRALVEKL